MDLCLPHAKSGMLGRHASLSEKTDGWTAKAECTVHLEGQTTVITAAMTATTKTVVATIVTVRSQVLEAITSLAQQATLSRTTTVPTLGGSPQVQDINPVTQPQEEPMLVQSLTTTHAPTPNLAFNLDLNLNLTPNLIRNLILDLHLHLIPNADPASVLNITIIFLAHLSQHNLQLWNNIHAQPRMVNQKCNRIGYQ